MVYLVNYLYWILGFKYFYVNLVKITKIKIVKIRHIFQNHPQRYEKLDSMSD